MGPSAIRIAGVEDRLRELGHTVVDEGDIAIKNMEEPKVGDEISVFADLVAQGRSSMTIAVTAEARERDGDTLFDVAKGEFTFVALDAQDRPRSVAARLSGTLPRTSAT